MFQVGEYIIYKKDLCLVEKIEESNQNREKYYKLTPVNDSTLSIKVPINNKFQYLRYPITKQEATQLIKKIPQIAPLVTNDKLLENEYRNLMKTNTHEDLIKIIKTAYLRNQTRKNAGKKESDKDQVFFEQAEKYLYTELAYALGKTYEECKNFVIEEVAREEKATYE